MHSKVRDYIEKSGGHFVVKSHEGKTLGKHKSRAEALKQLRAVEYAKAHDARASMGKLELPGAGQEEYLGHDNALDAFSPKVSSTPDPLQPHELPERHSNPHHSTDPLRIPLKHGASGNAQEATRYLQVEDPPGGPAVDAAPLDPMECDAAGSRPGGNQIVPQDPPRENLATERAEESANLHEHGLGLLGDASLDPMPRKSDEKRAAPGRMKAEEYRAPFEPGGNGDPSPNPSKQQTIGSTASVSIAGHENELAGAANSSQPDERTSSLTATDEGNPNQYEMLSTARKAPDLNEANEPAYSEWVPPSSGPDDRKQGWKDPSGDNDWLALIGAGPGVGGSEI